MQQQGGWLTIAGLSGIALLACRSPSQITVEISTDFPCGSLQGTAVYVGTIANLEHRPATVVTSDCDPTTNRVGSVVLVPSGANDSEVAIEVVGGVGTPIESCTPPIYGSGCIVARRALRFVPHTPLLLPLTLSASCKGVFCDALHTCVAGACVPASVDPASCSTLNTCIRETSKSDASAPGDASAVSTADANPDANAATPISDAAIQDASADETPVQPSVAFHDVTSAAYWSTFDIGVINRDVAGFIGAVFDNRYMTFVPFGQNSLPGSGIAARFDTQADFAKQSSWATFNTMQVNFGARGFTGGAFDGHRYIYFAPNRNGPSENFDGVVARYDTQGAFTDRFAWATADIARLDRRAAGFYGAVYDGQRYVFFIPWSNFGGTDGFVTRYDTQGDFAQAASWSAFDTTLVNPRSRGFVGATFDGRWINFVPFGSAASHHGVATRYDTQAPFASVSSWSTFDIASIRPQATGFAGGVYDDRYVYFVPNNNGAPSGLVARVDTHGDFTQAAAWSTFDAEAAFGAGATGFFGGAFDGRFVYFVPEYVQGGRSTLVRYDTQGDFGSSSSWSTFDTAAFDSRVGGFTGAAFDGKFLYLLPSSNGVVARFDAKTPGALPAGNRGSLF